MEVSSWDLAVGRVIQQMPPHKCVMEGETVRIIAARCMIIYSSHIGCEPTRIGAVQ